MGNTVPRRIPWSPTYIGKVDFFIRSSVGVDHSDRRPRVAQFQSGNQSVHPRRVRSSAGVHQLLRPLHGLERRFRVGRSLRLHHRAISGFHLSTLVITAPSTPWEVSVASRYGTDRDQYDRSNRLTGLLAPFGDLPDGNSGAPDIRHRLAL